MASVSDHYAHHLAAVYEWMIGDVEAALLRSAAELDAAGLLEGRGRVAIDLGAGIGLHALPLAQRGYHVIAIDSSDRLLSTLQARVGSLQITVINDDLLGFHKHLTRPVQAVLCMGDTLTHLSSLDAVQRLVAAVATSLSTGGVFVATFRDYVSTPLTAERRFIPVRSDAQRILTCVLEYKIDAVIVHDLLHEWRDDRWQQRVSSYSKLRLAPEWLREELQKHDLSVELSFTASGTVCVVATKV